MKIAVFSVSGYKFGLLGKYISVIVGCYMFLPYDFGQIFFKMIKQNLCVIPWCCC